MSILVLLLCPSVFSLPAEWGDPESRQQVQEQCVQL